MTFQEYKERKPKVMEDGTKAWLTQSGNYYCRREPDKDKWERIVYYNLKKEHIQLAKGKCKECGEILESQSCGDFVGCSCGKSFVDTDRWFPERQRYGGEVDSI